jgi:predicted metal-dependent hydrolase
VSQPDTVASMPLEDVVPVELFKAEVQAWAERIGVEPKEVHIRPMTRKWASCSSRGRLTFNSALMREPAPFRAEVIVHELLHLKVPNHGKVFKALLRAHLAGTSLEYQSSYGQPVNG